MMLPLSLSGLTVHFTFRFTSESRNKFTNNDSLLFSRMTSFIQVPIEHKVGKGNRILGPLKRDPSVEVSAYRDNQFKVRFQKLRNFMLK